MGPQAAVLLAFLTGCISLLFGILNFGDLKKKCIQNLNRC